MHLRIALFALLVALVASCELASGPSGLNALTDATTGTPKIDRLDYRDRVEVALTLSGAATRPQASLHWLGTTSAPGVWQGALLISDGTAEIGRSDKNAVLFECGMHGREWFASESCLWLIDELLRRLDDEEIKELLAEADVWVIPQTNPAGRAIDDRFRGDPTRYSFVCEGGSSDGSLCLVDDDCPGGDCDTRGWRTNANTSDCSHGVDLARNFSRGWDAAEATCGGTFMQYRGTAPFSEPESRNLRTFVHNQMISMVVIVHANTQLIYNRWFDQSSHLKSATEALAALSGSGPAGFNPAPTLVTSSVGGGSGQFSAWLTAASNVDKEPDLGTERNIPTFFIELPPSSYGGRFRAEEDDGSNGQHPSSPDVRLVWAESVRPVLLELIRQARAPGCDLIGGTEDCPTNDVGLVGAKIAASADAPGALRVWHERRTETLTAGDHTIVVAVQNFSTQPRTTDVSVTVDRDGAATSLAPVTLTLDPGERRVVEVSHRFEGHDDEPVPHRVEIALDADDFAENNTKSFAFEVVGLAQPDVELLWGPGVTTHRLHDSGELEITSKIPVLLPMTVLAEMFAPGASAGPIGFTIIPQLPQDVGPPSPRPPTRIDLAPEQSKWDETTGVFTFVRREGDGGAVAKLVMTAIDDKEGSPSVVLELTVDTSRLDVAPTRVAAWSFELRGPGHAFLSLVAPTDVELPKRDGPRLRPVPTAGDFCGR